jgi:5-methylcytosine-specific restriction endonuclease McrA
MIDIFRLSKKTRDRRALERPKRFLVFERDGYVCRYCGVTTRLDVADNHPQRATVDHVTPVCLGGSHDLDNLTTACWDCNNKKGHMPPPLPEPTIAELWPLSEREQLSITPELIESNLPE